MATKQRYHFSVGDSLNGPVGYCGAVYATSKEEALKKLRDALPEEQPVSLCTDDPDIEYVDVYFNWTEHPTVKDIDLIEELSEDKEENGSK